MAMEYETFTYSKAECERIAFGMMDDIYSRWKIVKKVYWNTTGAWTYTMGREVFTFEQAKAHRLHIYNTIGKDRERAWKNLMEKIDKSIG
jgi:hypothetical protein